jgi:hypothetical protein
MRGDVKMSIHTVGEIAAVLGVAGSIISIALWVSTIKTLRDIRDTQRKRQ